MSRAISLQQKEFIHNIVYKGMSKEDAYKLAFDFDDLGEDGQKKLREKANNVFRFPHVQDYYQEVSKDLQEKEADKAVWTRALATEKLMKLIDKAEEELYTDGQKITVSRMNAILLPVKELNLMNGFNETNINNAVSGNIQFIGEDSLED